MQEMERPTSSIVGLPSRATMQARVREAEYQDLRGRVDSRRWEGLFFVHLKKDLGSMPLDWIDCNDPRRRPPKPDNRTATGVEQQRHPAAFGWLAYWNPLSIRSPKWSEPTPEWVPDDRAPV